MIDGVDTVRVFASTCKSATTRCIDKLVNKIDGEFDRSEFLKNSLEILEYPEQSQNILKNAGFRNKIRLRRFVRAVNTCTIRHHHEIRWHFPKTDEEELEQLSLDWNYRDDKTYRDDNKIEVEPQDSLLFIDAVVV